MTNHNHSYLMAETPEERVAIGFRNFMEIWLSSQADGNSLPDIDTLKKNIKPYIIKEILIKAYAISNQKEKSIIDGIHDISSGIMMANAEIQKGLKPEYL